MIDELRSAYRSTYREYARKFDALERLRQANFPDANAIDSAVLQLERARSAYNSARDRLAQTLGGNFDPKVAAEVESGERRVSAAAHLLWELSGRPEGTAESDWNRAKVLVSSAR